MPMTLICETCLSFTSATPKHSLFPFAPVSFSKLLCLTALLALKYEIDRGFFMLLLAVLSNVNNVHSCMYIPKKEDMNSNVGTAAWMSIL